jgi:hypothetical protein
MGTTPVPGEEPPVPAQEPPAESVVAQDTPAP